MVFIFGAGASKAENAPTTDELLFRSLTDLTYDAHIEHVKDFLKEFFFVNVENLEKGRIPTFEETLTIIDISLSRQEDLSRDWNYAELTKVRNDLVYCIARILDQTLAEGGKLHKKFITSLFNNSRQNCKNTSFISLNYDLLLDNALIDLYPSKDWDLDYEIEFRNFIEPINRNREERAAFTQIPDEWHKPRKDRAILLLKPHGSLNWLYCPTCNTVKITKKEKGVLRIWTHSETCEVDRSLQKPLIIPPTWEKIFENPHLARIWLRATEVLRMADSVFFIGCSLPDSDIKLKYLFKKYLYHSDATSQLAIYVVLKNDEKTEETKRRYTRLFGQDVAFMTEGFENFVADFNQYI